MLTREKNLNLKSEDAKRELHRVSPAINNEKQKAVVRA